LLRAWFLAGGREGKGGGGGWGVYYIYGCTVE